LEVAQAGKFNKLNDELSASGQPIASPPSAETPAVPSGSATSSTSTASTISAISDQDKDISGNEMMIDHDDTDTVMKQGTLNLLKRKRRHESEDEDSDTSSDEEEVPPETITPIIEVLDEEDLVEM
jgi:hypothetical protein